MKVRISSLEQRVSLLEGRIFRIEFSQTMYKTVSFDVSSPGGYQRLETNNGTFLVSLKDAQPYLNGFRLTLNVGNPMSATYNGFKLTAKWGKAMPRDGGNYLDWEKSIREKEFSFVETLASGAWNRVAVNLAPAAADELGYLEFSMTTDVISLRDR